MPKSIGDEYDDWSTGHTRKTTGWSFLLSRGNPKFFCEKCVYNTGEHASFCKVKPQELKATCADGMKMRGK